MAKGNFFVLLENREQYNDGEILTFLCLLRALSSLGSLRWFRTFQPYDFLRNSSGDIPDSFKMARNVPSGISPE